MLQLRQYTFHLILPEMQYTNEPISSADILFIPIVLNQYDKYYEHVHQYLTKDAVKQNEEQEIFLPHLDYTQDTQSSKLVYYTPGSSSVLNNVKSFAIIECQQKLGSMKQLGYFIQDISVKFGKVAVIQQIGPNYKYDSQQFGEVLCERSLNLPELTTVKAMESISNIQDLKNMIVGSKVDQKLKKIDLNNDKLAFVFALSFPSS